MDFSNKELQYIFLDVVGFTRDRTLEDQVSIISTLNKIVKESVSKYQNSIGETFFIPTGDGICIVLDFSNFDHFDISIQIAVRILYLLYDYNSTDDINKSEKFKLRIGINKNLDIVFKDINKNKNAAGKGINDASRIMGFGDGGQILVGRAIYDTLTQREKYKSSFVSYKLKTKHNTEIETYHYVDKNLNFINSIPPQSVKSLPEEITSDKKKYPKPTKFVLTWAYQAMSNEENFLKFKGWGKYDAKLVLLWFLTNDSIHILNMSRGDEPLLATFQAGQSTFEEKLEYYHDLDFPIRSTLEEFITKRIAPYRYIFEEGAGIYLIVKSNYKEKLKAMDVDLWDKVNKFVI